MSHVPRRATQHGFHITGAETAPVSLKPGQLDLHRRGLYTLEGRGAPETYLSEEVSQQSEYGGKIATATCPQDYKVPAAAHRRPTSELSGGKKTRRHGTLEVGIPLLPERQCRQGRYVLSPKGTTIRSFPVPIKCCGAHGPRELTPP